MLVVALCFSVLGCSTTPQTDDDLPTDQRVEQQDDEHHGPPVEELADNPCSSDNWDEPPPGVTSMDQ